jgi:diaminopimelate epimerase
MPLKFRKMHAHGDDFVVVDLRGRANQITREMIRRLGDRNKGIGFNQLAVILDCNDADARCEFWNPDGSRLNACGSATRGIADILMREKGVRTVVLRTQRGLLGCERLSGGDISVGMGEPLLHWRDIPLAAEIDTLFLPIDGTPSACSMGNPHCTFFVDDLSVVDLAAIGPTIENHSLFPHKTNVHFVQVLNRGRIRLRIWERGGGIPLGSGSCACGAAVAGIRRGLLNEAVEIVCDGGEFQVCWDGVGSVHLIGVVESVFGGVLEDLIARPGDFAGY